MIVIVNFVLIGDDLSKELHVVSTNYEHPYEKLIQYFNKMPISMKEFPIIKAVIEREYKNEQVSNNFEITKEIDENEQSHKMFVNHLKTYPKILEHNRFINRLLYDTIIVVYNNNYYKWVAFVACFFTSIRGLHSFYRKCNNELQRVVFSFKSNIRCGFHPKEIEYMFNHCVQNMNG